MKCVYCGTELYDSISFCPSCGKEQGRVFVEKKKPLLSWMFCGINLVNFILVIVVNTFSLMCLMAISSATMEIDYELERKIHSADIFGSVETVTVLSILLIVALFILNLVFFIRMLAKHRDVKKHFIPQILVILMTVIILGMSFYSCVRVYDNIKDFYLTLIENEQGQMIADLEESNVRVIEDIYYLLKSDKTVGTDVKHPYGFFIVGVEKMEREIGPLSEAPLEEVEVYLQQSLMEGKSATLKGMAVPSIFIIALCLAEAVLMFQYKKREANV